MERENEASSTDEIEVTREMEAAGFAVLDDWTGVLDKASLAREAYIAMVRVRDRSKPDKPQCGYCGCALGTAVLAWGVRMKHVSEPSYWGLTYGDFERIFCNLGKYINKPFIADITPLDVADAIDRYLAST